MFDGTYKSYEIVGVGVIPSINTAYFRANLTTDGSSAGGNAIWVSERRFSNGSASNQQNTNTSHHVYPDTAMASAIGDGGINFTLKTQTPNLSDRFKTIQGFFHFYVGSYVYYIDGAGVMKSNTPATGIIIDMSGANASGTGNIASGNFKLYGIK